MKTKSIIVPQGTIKDINGEDNLVPNTLAYTAIALKDYISLDYFGPQGLPRFDLHFPNGIPTGITLIQVEDIWEDEDLLTNHLRFTYDSELISESQIKTFVQETLEVLGDPEYTNGASVRITEPFNFIDFYIDIPF